ncbi:hypothetical protein BE20_29635 [Sorangium cellulosum]|nr:hypothetical protein BE20_29635 [Sorangium cellulosum]
MGTPVDPDVYRMYAACSGDGSPGGGAADSPRSSVQPGSRRISAGTPDSPSAASAPVTATRTPASATIAAIRSRGVVGSIGT